MKKKLLLTLMSFVILYPAFAQTDSISFEGSYRHFRFHLPVAYDASIDYPLMLILHGNGSTAEEMEFYSQMNTVADTSGFIVVYPDGINNTWNSGFNLPYNSGTNDVGFISALIDSIGSDYSVNLNRVYACGMSMGGFMSFRLGCELNHKVAAIGSVTGLMSAFTAANCQHDFKMPVVFFHGTDDATVDYNGTAAFAGAEANALWWAEKNDCETSPEVTDLPDLVNEGSTVTTIHYNDCPGQSEVLLYKVVNGGHSWPGAIAIPSLGNTNKDIHASIELWKFFDKHKLITTSIAVNESQSAPNIFPNPFIDQLQLKHIENVKLIEVFDWSGRKIYTANNVKNQTHINLQGYSNGLYFV
ncbi:MAG: T9SS type A sorting domain-containing protein, partial [Bacteroidetes bacterium]|nr:T9SS type A sorting domain-containing protein [Bacteroidota bacterium]